MPAMSAADAVDQIHRFFTTLDRDGILLVVIVCIALFLVTLLLVSKPANQGFLDPTTFKPAILREKTVINHNTRRFRFALDHKKQRLGLPIGQHITFRLTDAKGKEVFRPYTPVSDDDLAGFVDFVVKVYPQGVMGQYLDKLEVGQPLMMKGPRGRFRYGANAVSTLGMIAGGSGITPMYQVANAILKNRRDATRISLIYANVTEEDILLREELDAWARMHPNFTVHYVLNTPPANWTGSTGFVTSDIIKQHLPGPEEDCMVLRCGPPPMNKAVEGHLTALGYASEKLFEF